MPDTGYPDWQTARDFLSGLVGNQQVDTAGQVGIAGTRTIATIAPGTTYVIRSLLIAVSMQATGVGGSCALGVTVQISAGFDGASPLAALLVTDWRITDNDSASVAFVIPGPISIHAAGGANLLQLVTTKSPAGFFDFVARATAYAVVI